jgi:hypothetical protein
MSVNKKFARRVYGDNPKYKDGCRDAGAADSASRPPYLR